MAAAQFHSVDTASTNGTTLTKSITIANNDNRVLVVSIAVGPTLFGSPPTVSSVVFNGTENLTRIKRILSGGRVRSEMWAIVNPTNTTANVVITISGAFSANIVGAYSQLKNVAQTGSLRDDDSAQGADGSPETTVSDTRSTDLNIDSMGMDTGTSINVDAGQTIRASKSNTSGGNTTQLRVSTKSGTDSAVTMGYDAVTGSPRWAMIQASLKSSDAFAKQLALMGVGH